MPSSVNEYGFFKLQIVINTMAGQRIVLRMLSIQYLRDAFAENEKKRRVAIST
jgi:hypothetical protein